MSYVKSSDVSDQVVNLFSSIAQEPDTSRRKELILSASKAVSKELEKALVRLCYEMKTNGIPTDVIAVELGISQRAVLRGIRRHAKTLGIRNPLLPIPVSEFFDIRSTVVIEEKDPVP